MRVEFDQLFGKSPPVVSKFKLSYHAGPEPKYKSTFLKCERNFVWLKICVLILTVKLEIISAKYYDI